MSNLLKAGIMILALFFVIALTQPKPGLVGYGCDGAGGPIYAFEESDFPMCVKIEPVD
jgi:hypothetical protein